MDRESLINMDNFMFLSIVNMKLRDQYSNLEDLSYDLDLSEEEILKKLKNIGYKYDEGKNQFIGV
ncbi:DUF4250 domain-containing protein [Hathewaya massiliensis]|uniref:DUF4250 domain-containing protein n=1 Tax=Hathewaya massiliensis TaxID=1964382 RepID=UPI00115C2F4A|nr:DUF4250 domain-containing protein [Hathewaya massiliensis]